MIHDRLVNVKTGEPLTVEFLNWTQLRRIFLFYASLERPASR